MRQKETLLPLPSVIEALQKNIPLSMPHGGISNDALARVREISERLSTIPTRLIAGDTALRDACFLPHILQTDDLEITYEQIRHKDAQRITLRWPDGDHIQLRRYYPYGCRVFFVRDESRDPQVYLSQVGCDPLLLQAIVLPDYSCELLYMHAYDGYRDGAFWPIRAAKMMLGKDPVTKVQVTYETTTNPHEMMLDVTQLQRGDVTQTVELVHRWIRTTNDDSYLQVAVLANPIDFRRVEDREPTPRLVS